MLTPNEIRRADLMIYLGKVLGVMAAMPAEMRAEFEAWDNKRPEGMRTSDWPGFEPLIGKRP